MNNFAYGNGDYNSSSYNEHSNNNNNIESSNDNNISQPMTLNQDINYNLSESDYSLHRQDSISLTNQSSVTNQASVININNILGRSIEPDKNIEIQNNSGVMQTYSQVSDIFIYPFP